MNPWEEEILVALVWHLRVLSVEQIARTWWQGQATANRRATDAIKARQQSGWLHVRELISRPTVPLEGPLVCWEPGQRAPDFEDLSRLLHRRARTAARKIMVVSATRKSRQLYGVAGSAQRPKLTQVSHELFVAEVFIRYPSFSYPSFRVSVSTRVSMRLRLCDERIAGELPGDIYSVSNARDC